MTTLVKCQAKNPEACTDPQCPERKSYRHAMATATNLNDYAAARARRDADMERQNPGHKNQRAREFLSNYPKPPAPKTGKTPNQGQRNQPPARRVETTPEGDPVIKFHRDLGFPKGFTPPSGSRQLVYSRHAIQEGQSEKYANSANEIPQFPKINLDTMELIELKVNGRTKQVHKLLYRGELDEDRDICMVLKPVGNGKMVVVTQWINLSTDAHKTLRAEEYVDLRNRA